MTKTFKVTFGIHTDIFCRFFIEMLQFQKEHIENYSEDSDMIGCVMILFLLA